jgi:aspartate aminotransferase
MEGGKSTFSRVVEYASAADRDVIDLVSGEPDWDPPDRLRDALHEVADGAADQFQYPPNLGLTALRDEIAARRGIDRSRVVITNGTVEANHLAVTTGLEQFSGSQILLPDPVYPYYDNRVDLLGADRMSVPVDDTGKLDPEVVRDAVDETTAVILVNSPNNPMGTVYERDRIEALVGIAEDNDALLVSDEVYDQFDFTGRFESALEVDSGHVAVTNAFSKSMAITGLRVGYLLGPPADGAVSEFFATASNRHMLTNMAVSRPSQYAVLRALEETPSAYYERNRERVRDRIEAFTDVLAAVGAEYTEPEGAFYVMARFEGFPGTLENVKRLVDEAGVAGMPGDAFGQARADWFRFALVTPRADEAADRLAEYF